MKEYLSNFWWRIDNLYTVIPDDGPRCKFKLRPAQRYFLENMHHRNIILKSRQLGFTTMMALFQLDAILWYPDTLCGFVAQDEKAAKRLFHEKVLNVYKFLPDWLKSERPLISKDQMTLRVSHPDGAESSICVGTSLRSGSYNYIHVSEVAKICAQSSEKERELTSGTLNSGYHINITLESTAESASGFYYNTCQRAEQIVGRKLTPMDYKFFFFPWYEHESSYLPDEYVDEDVIRAHESYFQRECSGIDLSLNQKMWYIKKRAEIDDLSLMFREYPSNSSEAFRTANNGSYYAEHLLRVWSSGRVLSEKFWDDDSYVHVSFDIGVGDYTALTFFVLLREGGIGYIDYYENNRHGVEFYLDYIMETGYKIGRIIFPHDGNVVEFSTGLSRAEYVWMNYGIKVEVLPRTRIIDRINNGRRVMRSCKFYEPNCGEQLKYLQNYREGFNRSTGSYTGVPEKGVEVHCADSFGYSGDAYFSHDIDLSMKKVNNDVEILEIGAI